MTIERAKKMGHSSPIFHLFQLGCDLFTTSLLAWRT
jgi:hypothetical protein